MHFRNFFRVLLCYCLLALSTKLHSAGRDAFSFLLMTPSPRAAGLGESYVSVAEGPETVFSNPSGLAFENQPQSYVQSLVPPFIEGIKYNHLIYVQPLTNGAWAVHTGILHAGGFTRTIADASSPDGYQEAGNFSAYDLQFAGTIGKKFGDRMGVGTTIRYLRESLGDAQVNGYALDLGILYRDDVYPVQLGLSVRNLGPKVRYLNEAFNLPLLFATGISVKNIKENKIGWIPEKSMLTTEFFKPVSGDSSVRSGIEIPCFEHLTLRTGYEYNFKKQGLGSNPIPNGLAFGFGIQMPFWSFDYALVSLGEIGLSHRIGFDLKWAS